jgi:hypothetical protein
MPLPVASLPLPGTSDEAGPGERPVLLDALDGVDEPIALDGLMTVEEPRRSSVLYDPAPVDQRHPALDALERFLAAIVASRETAQAR